MHGIETIRKLNAEAEHPRRIEFETEELPGAYTKEEIKDLRSQYRHDLGAFPGF